MKIERTHRPDLAPAPDSLGDLLQRYQISSGDAARYLNVDHRTVNRWLRDERHHTNSGEARRKIHSTHELAIRVLRLRLDAAAAKHAYSQALAFPETRTLTDD